MGQRTVFFLILLLFSVHLLVSSFTIMNHDISRDEGFYLISAALLAQGKFPYLDYMFSQMPLSPILIWLNQNIFGQSIYIGRMLMLFLMTLSHAVLLWFGFRRTAHIPTTLILTMLSISTVLYLDRCSVVKNYAPAILFGSIGWVMLLIACDNASTKGKQAVLICLSGFFLSASVNTRLILAPCAAVGAGAILYYCSRNRLKLLGIYIVGAIPSAIPFFGLCALDSKRTIFFVVRLFLRLKEHPELGGLSNKYEAIISFALWPQHIILGVLIGYAVFRLRKYAAGPTAEMISDSDRIAVFRRDFIITALATGLLFIINILPNPVHFEYFTVLVPWLLILCLPGIYYYSGTYFG